MRNRRFHWRRGLTFLMAAAAVAGGSLSGLAVKTKAADTGVIEAAEETEINEETKQIIEVENTSEEVYGTEELSRDANDSDIELSDMEANNEQKTTETEIIRTETIEPEKKAFTASDVRTIPAVLASFDFNDTGLDGGNAKAAAFGSIELQDRDEQNGKAVYFNGNSFLTVTDIAEDSLLTGVDELTLSYDAKPDNSNHAGWTFYAAPNADNLH